VAELAQDRPIAALPVPKAVTQNKVKQMTQSLHQPRVIVDDYDAFAATESIALHLGTTASTFLNHTQCQ
jgi:hypothetical protein